MAGVRDFREETINYIRRNLVDADPNWDAFYDFFRDVFSFNKNLEDDLSNFDKYMVRVCEINDITASKLDQIVEDVYSVENANDAKLIDQTSGLRQCRSLLEKLYSEISRDDFEAGFNKSILYDHWNNTAALEKLRRALENMSAEELIEMDISGLSEAEQEVYTEVLMNKMMAPDLSEIDQPELMSRLQALGAWSDLKNKIYIGLLLTSYIVNPGPEQVELVAALIAELAASSPIAFSVEGTLIEIPFLVPNGTAKYSVEVSLTPDSPNAVMELQASLTDNLLKISTAVGKSSIFISESIDSMSLGAEVDGVSVELNANLLLAGILNVTWSSEVETEGCGVSTSLEVTTSMNRPQLQKTPALTPVSVSPSAVEGFVKEYPVEILVGIAVLAYTASIPVTGGATAPFAPVVYGSLGFAW